MNWYTLIKSYYERGLYTAENLAVFVRAGMITEAEAQEITGGGGA